MKTPVANAARTLICLCFNSQKRIDDNTFLEVGFNNNVPNMLSALSYHHFRHNGVVAGSKELWELVRKGINNLETKGTYEEEQ